MNGEKFCTYETAWCPGCGDFVILDALKETLNGLGLEPENVLIVGGIGQAAKMPQYINANGFCGLHGRALPPAVAAKIANKNLTVIVNSGDGDSYGEGGNHYIHNIRRNVDITHLVHDNQIYGLTKGQASPTTEEGHITDVQPEGSLNTQMNPLLIAIALGAGFVARGFTGEKEHLKYLMKEAIDFNGYAIVDILQPCVSFNKINTFQWYNKRVYKLDESYEYDNFEKSILKAREWGDKIPIGIIYRKEKPSFIDKIPFLRAGLPLVEREPDIRMVQKFMDEFR